MPHHAPRPASAQPLTRTPSGRCGVCERAVAIVAGMCADCRARMLAGIGVRTAAPQAAPPRRAELVDRIPGVLYRASPDRQRRLSYVTDAIAGLCGIEAPEFRAGRHALGRLIHADDRDRVAEALADPAAAVGYDLQYRITTASEEVRWVSDRGRRTGRGSLVWDEGLLLDVTESRAELERLLHEARHDPLTGAANRRALTERLEEECARAERSGQPMCALCVDADHFKAVNDTHGHDTGDRVLVDIAARLQQAVRRYDMVARVGGEEFTVLLIGIGTEEGAGLAERIRGAIADAPCGGVRVTASIGCAGWRPGDTPEALVKRADEALYAAKAAGRNRVVAAA